MALMITIVLIIRIFAFDEATIKQKVDDPYYSNIGELSWYTSAAAGIPILISLGSICCAFVALRTTKFSTENTDEKREIRNVIAVLHLKDQYTFAVYFILYYALWRNAKSFLQYNLSGHILVVVMTIPTYLRNVVINLHLSRFFAKNQFKKISLFFKCYCVLDLIGTLYLYYTCVFTVFIFHLPAEVVFAYVIAAAFVLLIFSRKIYVPIYEYFIAWMVSRFIGCEEPSTDNENQKFELTTDKEAFN